MNDDYDLKWQLHIRSQARVTSRRQALAAGWSRKAIEWRLQRGSWRRLQRAAYGAFTGDVPRTAKLWAAIQRAGAGAVLCLETAAEVHGFAEGPSSKVHLAVPAGRNPARCGPIPGVIVHRMRNLVPEWQPPRELPRTSVPDTVLDLVSEAKTFDDAYGWICRAIGKQLTTTAALREALARRTRIRWRKWLTEALSESDQGIDSPLERRYVRDVERAHGLPAATRQAKERVGSGTIYLDNLYEPYQICVELDGVAAHPAEGRWADAKRDNANLADSDTRTFRFGWVAATEGRCESAQQVARALQRHGWDGKPHPCSAGCPVGRS
jgi:hypothetical protein